MIFLYYSELGFDEEIMSGKWTWFVCKGENEPTLAAEEAQGVIYVRKRVSISRHTPPWVPKEHWGTDRVMECEVLKEIARETGNSIAQVNTL